MSWQDDALARVRKLIERGREILGTKRNTAGYEFVDYGPFHGWRTQTMNAIGSLLGPDHIYSLEFAGRASTANPSSTAAGIEILTALEADIEAGHLNKLAN